MSALATSSLVSIDSARSLLRCVDCACALGGEAACPACGRLYPERDGILDAIGELTGRNRIAAAFYEGPGWARFRPWERLFLRFQGGQRGARRVILRHLPQRRGMRLLEVGIGDGDNLPWLPPGQTVYGVDVARSRLAACAARFPALRGKLAWAEGEALPFEDAVFDAAYSVGGFNFFRDHAAALREMCRVVRPGGTIVVADEIPELFRFAPGHALGFEEFDRWALVQIGLDLEFVDMALTCRLDVRTLAAAKLPGSAYHRIWNRLGYCLVSSVGCVESSRPTGFNSEITRPRPDTSPASAARQS